jgi:1-acyl-sn-glycerol-3-phosphate acyltransferase
VGVSAQNKRQLTSWIKRIVLEIPQEFFWFNYILGVVFLAALVHIRRVGQKPPRPCVLAVTHVSGYGFDPLFVVWASRRFRSFALYSIDRPNRFVRFLCQSFWRFGVTADPARKNTVNSRTLEAAVDYLRRGGVLQVYPEGEKFWEGRLYPGAAVLARRAGVPLIPVGLENAPRYEPEVIGVPILKGLAHALRRTLAQRWIAVHFGPPIYPNSALPEKEDVDRMMNELAQAFQKFYQDFYGLPGPVWLREKEAE